MTRKRWIYLIGAIVVTAGVLVAVLSGPREPEYGGRRLSEWVGDLDPPAYPSSDIPSRLFEEAENAIRHIGPNAVPYLLKWVQYEVPPWEVKSRKLVEQVLRRRTDIWGTDKKLTISWQAFEAFPPLGPAACAAIPELSRLMNDSSHVWRAERAASSLGCIGQDSLPTLLAALTNEASPIGYQAGRAIGRMGTNARPALPSLVGLLTITNRSAAFAAEILGDLKAGPELVVPALTKCLRDSVNPLARYSSARALGQFGGEARSAVPALLHAVNDPIAAVRREASNALQQIDPKALGRVEVRATGEGKKAE